MDEQISQSNIPPIEPHKSWFVRHILAEILGIVLFGVIVAGAYYYQASNSAPIFVVPVHHEQTDATANWKTYTSVADVYELKYPMDWQVKTGDDAEGGQYVKISNTNNSSVSIFPRGVGREGAPGEYKTITDDLTQAEESKISEVSTENGGPYLYDIHFKNPPKNWTSFGFIEGSASIPDVTYKDKPNKDELGALVYGQANKGDLAVIIQILSTFKFITPTVVNSFASCAAAGYPIMESFPEQCKTPDGVTFVKNSAVCIQVIAQAKNPTTGEIRDFPTPCDIPVGWQKVESSQ